MKFDTGNWPILLQPIGDRFNSWLNLNDQHPFLWSVLGIALVFVFRKQISARIVGLIQRLLKQFSVSLSEETTTPLTKAVGILAVTSTVYVTLQIFQPQEIAAEFLIRVLKSIAIITVFATWFQLSGPFTSLLRTSKSGPIKVETDWIQSVTKFAIVILGVTALLEVWQVDISGALTGVGVLGAGLAIAAQDLIRNLIAGITNLSEKRFETGDVIQIEGQFFGTVKRIELRSTLIVGFDQIPRHVPNSALSDSVVLNLSERKQRRLMLKVPLVLSSTQEQIEAVRDGLKDYHQSCGDFDLSEDASKYIYVSNLGSSSVDILIYVWTTGPDYDQFLQISERLTLAILKIVKTVGTRLAYATQTIKLDGEPTMPSSELDQAPPAS
ncbi:MAG: mechanosensitive ion channel family protein [Rhizobiaceae bacterium]